MSGAWRKKERKKEHIGYIMQLSQVVRLDFFFLFFFNQEMCPFKQYAHTHTHAHKTKRFDSSYLGCPHEHGKQMTVLIHCSTSVTSLVITLT